MSDVSQAVALLAPNIKLLTTHPDKQATLAAKDTVYRRFQKVFSRDNLPKLTAEEMTAFLRFENNQHWSGLQRQAPNITHDMRALRKSLSILLDEKEPLVDRMNRALSKVNGMGKGISTAILHVTYPKKYGVWNRKAEMTMRKYGIFPEFERGVTTGEKYQAVNSVLLEVSRRTALDLWAVDSLWWEPETTVAVGCEIEAALDVEIVASRSTFGLERHLHEFLRDNWEHTELGRDWDLFVEPDEDEVAGYEYPTSIGRIDLLAKHKKKNEWLVVELKRDQTADATVGQVLRYIGWVRQELAKGESVRGLIIAHASDERLRYALSEVANVDLKLYEVEFRLK
jgi:RecB family endonuclease NucS